MKKSALLAVLMIATIPAVGLTQEEKAAAPAPTQAPTPEPEPSNWTSSHSIAVGAETVAYDAEVGSIILRDDKERPLQSSSTPPTSGRMAPSLRTVR